MLEAVAARAAAIERTPAWLRRSADNLPALEDRMVAAVLRLTGLGPIAEVREEAGRSRDSKLATFDAFHRVHPDFPVRMTAGRFEFHYDDVATALLNEPESTPMYSAWVDARRRMPSEGRAALVFPWARIRTRMQGARGLCVLHDSDLVAGSVTTFFRIALPTAHGTLHLEPLPAFVAGCSA